MFPPSYFPGTYFPPTMFGVGSGTGTGGTYFAPTYFASSYFAASYFGAGSGAGGSGWKHNAPGCPCCGSSPCIGQICFDLHKCGGPALDGALIAITEAGTPIVGSPITSDASGNACISIPAADTYTYTITKAGYETKTGTIAATCTTNNVSFTFGASLCVTARACEAGFDPYLQGALVTVKSGGTTIATVTTDGSGVGCVQLLASTGSYSIEVSAYRFDTDIATRTITCGTTHIADLVPSTGYACNETNNTSSCRQTPIAKTLYLTTPAGTSVTLTWDPFDRWTGTDTRSIANASDCSNPGFVSQNITFGWRYEGDILTYDYKMCSLTGSLGAGTDPVQGDTCGAFFGVATASSTAGSENANSNTPPGCGPFSYSGTFPAFTSCSIRRYYTGTATITE